MVMLRFLVRVEVLARKGFDVEGSDGFFGKIPIGFVVRCGSNFFRRLTAVLENRRSKDKILNLVTCGDLLFLSTWRVTRGLSISTTISLSVNNLSRLTLSQWRLFRCFLLSAQRRPASLPPPSRIRSSLACAAPRAFRPLSLFRRNGIPNSFYCFVSKPRPWKNVMWLVEKKSIRKPHTQFPSSSSKRLEKNPMLKIGVSGWLGWVVGVGETYPQPNHILI